MRNFYKKDEKILSVKSLDIKDENIKNVILEELTLNKDVLYYESLLSAFYRFSDDNQTLTREEAYDQIHRDIDKIKDIEKLKQIKLLFIDTSDKFPLPLTKEERKKLKKEKKTIKKQKRKTR